MEKKNLLFSGMSVSNDLIIIKDFAPEFKKYFNISLITFSNSKKVKEEADKIGASVYQIPFYDKEKRLVEEEICRALSEIEKKIDYPVEKVIFGDPEFYKIYKEDRISALSWFIKIFFFCERIIKEKKIDVHYVNGNDHIFNFLPYLIMKSMNRKSYNLVLIPYHGISLTRSFLTDDLESSSAIQKTDYQKHVESLKKESVSYLDYFHLNKHLSMNGLKRLFKVPAEDLAESRNIYKSLGRITLWKILLFFPRKIKLILKLMLLNLLVYRKIDPRTEYVYYPLHYIEDGQVRIKYPEGYNQYELVRNIAKNIPARYNLIIKEHPGFRGQYSMRELLELAKNPKIVVVNSKTSSKEIFPRSICTITVNSTVGYEALFFNNIVLIFGGSFYKNLPGVTKIDTPENIFNILNDDELIKKKREEIKNNLETAVKKLLDSSLKMDYGHLLRGEKVDREIGELANFLQRLVYKK
ncbi:hypothetical protein HYT23_03850 [Candidatus Pacearchaeota archaeon]|nr:hypothetical protein [Candidatus Pacearchaeota archaeon]